MAMPSMRMLLCAATAVLSVAGCVNNRVLVDVDVRSFLRESDLVNAYDAAPLVTTNDRIEPVQVNLVENFGDLGGAHTVTLQIALDYVNVTGTGTGTFTLYIGDDAATLFMTPAVASLNVDLQPSTTTRSEVTIPVDERVLDLFTSQRLYVGADLGWTPSGVEPLQGDCVIVVLNARVESRLSVF
jgi:hypothetical protein